MTLGGFVGRQPETVSDPNSPLHETCWVWAPSATTEIWILYKGPASAHPYVDPAASRPHVWMELEHAGGPDMFADVAAFTAWVLARLGAQGRPSGMGDIVVRSHTIA